MNLLDITREFSVSQAKLVDQALSDYILGTIRLLESQGKDITKYTLVKVDNPMELKENSMKVSSQWRIMKVSDLQNPPTYEGER